MAARCGRTSFSTRARAPTVSISFDTRTPGEVAAALGAQGICVWDGNFYAARAVEVLGLTERGGLLRTGISMYSMQDELQQLLDALAAM